MRAQIMTVFGLALALLFLATSAVRADVTVEPEIAYYDNTVVLTVEFKNVGITGDTFVARIVGQAHNYFSSTEPTELNLASGETGIFHIYLFTLKVSEPTRIDGTVEVIAMGSGASSEEDFHFYILPTTEEEKGESMIPVVLGTLIAAGGIACGIVLGKRRKRYA